MPYLDAMIPRYTYCADDAVVSSQQEALADGTRYAYGLITTKCLPDVLPTTELVKDALASGQVDAWALIQVSYLTHGVKLL
jgi:hypothetical protein